MIQVQLPLTFIGVEFGSLDAQGYHLDTVIRYSNPPATANYCDVFDYENGQVYLVVHCDFYGQSYFVVTGGRVGVMGFGIQHYDSDYILQLDTAMTGFRPLRWEATLHDDEGNELVSGAPPAVVLRQGAQVDIGIDTTVNIPAGLQLYDIDPDIMTFTAMVSQAPDMDRRLLGAATGAVAGRLLPRVEASNIEFVNGGGAIVDSVKRNPSVGGATSFSYRNYLERANSVYYPIQPGSSPIKSMERDGEYMRLNTTDGKSLRVRKINNRRANA